MAKSSTQKTRKRASGKRRPKARAAARKPATRARPRTPARKPTAGKTAGSGLVYTSLLREALAARTR